MVLEDQTATAYTTVRFTVIGIATVVGYDLELPCCQDALDENWEVVKKAWSKDFAAEPVNATVVHKDIKREVNAMLFPLKSISAAERYHANVTGALMFGDFCPDTGQYMPRDGNTPALCSEVMFGRVYFVPRGKLNSVLSVSELVYDHVKSEAEAAVFDSKYICFFYKTACLDVQTVADDSYRDPALRCDAFSHRFPFCTEKTMDEITAYRAKLVQSGNVSLPPIPPHDPAGRQQEITCVSLSILNPCIRGGHCRQSSSSAQNGKRLCVLYNKLKAKDTGEPVADRELAASVGVEDVQRISLYPCHGELSVLENVIALLVRFQVDLLYVYDAQFAVRVVEQRIYFYAQSTYSRCLGESMQRRCAALQQAWEGLFGHGQGARSAVPVTLCFGTVRYMEAYKRMLINVGAALPSGPGAVKLALEQFRRDKAAIGHFKFNSSGMGIVDLGRVARDRDARAACTGTDLYEVASFHIVKHREMCGKHPKDSRKLCAVAQVDSCAVDRMLSDGGERLFAVLLNGVVRSQMCARLAKVLNPVSVLFHRCRLTLNINVLTHGRGDTFHGGLVQSVHSVQMPQLQMSLQSLRVKAGLMGRSLPARLRWSPQCGKPQSSCPRVGNGGPVLGPLTGLHYAGPGMGLELSFDFASMYPSIMCALNISPESTVPWPPSKFPHDLSGWICYSWEEEGYDYASLVLKYDHTIGGFVKQPAALTCALDYILQRRAEFKGKIEHCPNGGVEVLDLRAREKECKVLANTFYGMVGDVCGALVSSQGRRQMSVVNKCVSSFYGHSCPVIYGDTDSLMFCVGHGTSGQDSEVKVDDLDSVSKGAEQRNRALEKFAEDAVRAVTLKCDRAHRDVPSFLRCVHKALVEDCLSRMYVIGQGNSHSKLMRDPAGRYTEDGYPVYVGLVPCIGPQCFADVTQPFVLNRGFRLVHESSSSVFCHMSKKVYAALTHETSEGVMESVRVKARGLRTLSGSRTLCGRELTDTFLACVVRGECLKLETDPSSCFTTVPWHCLKSGDVILYLKEEPVVDTLGRWSQLQDANSFLAPFRVENVTTLPLDFGMGAVSVSLASAKPVKAGGVLVVNTLHKDWMYCLNHLFSRKEAILRDLLMCKASELTASKASAGFFNWSGLVKTADPRFLWEPTKQRLRVSSVPAAASYVEIVGGGLQEITGLRTGPVRCHEFEKCEPCEATFHKFPLDLSAERLCLRTMYGQDTLLCEMTDECRDAPQHNKHSGDLMEHPHLPGILCLANSRVLIADLADRCLVSSHGKLIAHCVIDLCLPCGMYGSSLTPGLCLPICRGQLLNSISSARRRLENGSRAFHAMMNHCPKHMIPAGLGKVEMDMIRTNRENLFRMPPEKVQACREVIESDMALQPCRVYTDLRSVLGKRLGAALAGGLLSIDDVEGASGTLCDTEIVVFVPCCILKDEPWIPRGPTCRLVIQKGHSGKKALVNLAALLYRTVLAWQLHEPSASKSPAMLYPDTVLCIIPYSSMEGHDMQSWMKFYRAQRWFDRLKGSGKRQVTPFDVIYHCAGCKQFYSDLNFDSISCDGLMGHYGSNKRRRTGMCLCEQIGADLSLT